MPQTPEHPSVLSRLIRAGWRSPSALSVWRGLGLGLAFGLVGALMLETWGQINVPGLSLGHRLLLVIEGLVSDTTGPISSSWWFVGFVLAAGVALGRGFTDFWASIKLAIFLFCALAAACIAGTLIPQSDLAQAYAKTYNLAYGDSLWTRLVVWHDIFHARWFVGLLLALSLNLSVCTLRRWGKTYHILRRPLAERGRKVPFKQTPLATVEIDAPAAEAGPRAERLFGRYFGKIRDRDTDQGLALYGERGRFSRLGMYVIHLSVLVIYLGVLIGLWFGYSGDLQVWEGDSNRVFKTADGRSRTLPFTIFCNRFQLLCNPVQKDHVDQYRSEVTVIEPATAGVVDPDWPLYLMNVIDGWRYRPEVIEVNLRLIHRGLAFSQSSWGAVARGVILAVTDPWGRRRTYRIAFRSMGSAMGQGMPHEPVNLSGLGARLVVSRVAGPEQCRPVAIVNLIQFLPGRRAHRRLTFMLRTGQSRTFTVGGGCHLAPGPPWQRAAGFFACFRTLGQWRITLTQVDVRYYTVLTVAHHPGLWLIWLGASLMVVGFIWSFYFSHRKVWLVILPAGTGSRLEIFGAANKNQYGLKLWAGRLADKLRRRLNDKGAPR
jgi:cytochrome c biogenesis protein